MNVVIYNYDWKIRVLSFFPILSGKDEFIFPFFVTLSSWENLEKCETPVIQRSTSK